ncbi:hypothetical protein PHSY_006539 [Pseudozyma hubeiensis SY62]|uniref:Uncharacterized protein n=1 Tax=Pseudozyma hubeiensis (strain SY62) TaxID=1305764 RepID=R9PCJ2_PSEHS|nr:hypothetical protein PHSY_006539 [Pseudozyma hubeiensis SY62]GAC98942.1 hypothetical protein PHSY_006539 [Pseudozyma hubeiensis SY62]
MAKAASRASEAAHVSLSRSRDSSRTQQAKSPGEEKTLDEAITVGGPPFAATIETNARVQLRFTGHIAVRGLVSDLPSLHSSPG